MATITIDGKEYDSDDLSEDAKGQIISLQYAGPLQCIPR